MRINGIFIFLVRRIYPHSELWMRSNLLWRIPIVFHQNPRVDLYGIHLFWCCIDLLSRDIILYFPVLNIYHADIMLLSYSK